MSAHLSACGSYRYLLGRQLDADQPALPMAGLGPPGSVLFIMLNPSTADADNDDPTIRRCKGFARRFGASRLEVVNLYAYRATDPGALMALDYRTAVGTANDVFIEDAAKRAGTIIAAWGTRSPWPDRGIEVQRLIGGLGKPLYCLGTTKHGLPRHPLYLPADAPLQRL